VKIIKGNRGSGKTTKLIEQSYIYGYRIVVTSNIQKKYIQKTAKEMCLEIVEPLTYDELMKKRNVDWEEIDDIIIIDELEYFLQFILKSPVKLATISDDVVDLDKINNRTKTMEEF
jgi:thymidine kinase